MALFFDNKQHLREMKKIFLLEKRIEKIENFLESQPFQNQGQRKLLEEEKQRLQATLKEELSKWIIQELQAGSSFALELENHILEKVKICLETLPFEKIEAMEQSLKEVQSLLQGPQRIAQRPTEAIPTAEIFHASQNASAPTKQELRLEVEKILMGRGEKRREGKREEKEIEKLVEETFSRNYENRIKKELETLFARKEEVPHPPSKEEISETVEEVLEGQYLSKIEKTIEKQNRKIRKLEKKIRSLTLMISQLDFQDEDEDEDEEELWDWQPVKRKARKPSPAPRKKRLPRKEVSQEPMASIPNMSPEKNAALESIFNMNLELQNSL